MGTDNPVRPHTEVLREIHHLAEAGLGQSEPCAPQRWTPPGCSAWPTTAARSSRASGRTWSLLTAPTWTPATGHRIRAVWHNGKLVTAA